MKVFDQIKSALGFKPSVRNRPGGMSWIRGVKSDCGAATLNGRAVKTVKVQETGLWLIDPPQRFTATKDAIFGMSQRPINKGAVVSVTEIADALLEPWKEDGVTDAEVRELFAPKTKEPSHV